MVVFHVQLDKQLPWHIPFLTDLFLNWRFNMRTECYYLSNIFHSPFILYLMFMCTEFYYISNIFYSPYKLYLMFMCTEFYY